MIETFMFTDHSLVRRSRGLSRTGGRGTKQVNQCDNNYSKHGGSSNLNK